MTLMIEIDTRHYFDDVFVFLVRKIKMRSRIPNLQMINYMGSFYHLLVQFQATMATTTDKMTMMNKSRNFQVKILKPFVDFTS